GSTLDGITREITDQHVRVFTVGLRSSAYDPVVLRSLAATSGGTYTEAGTATELETIFDRLGYRLAGDYLLSYRSPASAGKHVEVQVSVDGVPGVATAEYA